MNQSRSYPEIREAALALKEEERAALAEELLDTLEADEVTDETAGVWLGRLKELTDGQVEGVPLEKAITDARRRLRGNAETNSSPGSQ